MAEIESSEPELQDKCTVCGAEIWRGDSFVTIARNIERMGLDGVIDVEDSDTLASLCAACGRRFPEGRIRISFIGHPGA